MISITTVPLPGRNFRNISLDNNEDDAYNFETIRDCN